MKCTVGLIMAVAAISANAQSFNDLPECGKTCVQNMLAKAAELDCEANDVACLCKNVNFTYGIRDCSLQSCADGAEAVINYGAEYCRNEGVVITTAGSGANTENPADTTVTATPAEGTSGSDSDDGQNVVPIATSTHETVIEENGSSVTSTSVETIFSSSESATDEDGASKTDESETPNETDGGNSGGGGGGGDGNSDSDGGSGDGNNDGDDADGGDADGGDDSGVARAAPAGLLAIAAIAAFFV